MNLKQFKSIDLLLFSLVALIFEVINRFATVQLFKSFSIIFMSFTIVLTLISMYRWGISGIIVSIFAKLISVVISTHNNDIKFYVSYIFGTLIAVLIGYLLFQKLIGRKQIKKTAVILSYLLFDFALFIIITSFLFALFDASNFGYSFTNNLKSLLVQESMSIFTSAIILLIANRKNGNIVVEMGNYVKEVHEMKKLGNLKELKESSKFNSDSPFTEFDQIDNSTILDGGTMDVDQMKELAKLYEESDKISIDKPIDALVEQKGKEKNV